MFDDVLHLEEIVQMFPLQPLSVINTTGIGFGLIVKYETFYLKIYDAERNRLSYDITGFLYGKAEPIFSFTVPYRQITEFTKQIDEDNYLIRPIEVSWLQPPLDPLHYDHKDGY